MTELFQQLLAWVSQNPGWSYSVIFLVAMAESLAIVGLVVPGVVIMFGIGALIASGAIAFWPAMGWAVAGAVAGDGLSFWLGHHYREQLTSTWPFSRHPQSLQRGVEFFERYGGKSVALGRFFGPIRAVIPLVAGMMGMAPLRFVAANVLSALAWAPLYLLPGIVFGASLELASEVAMRLVILGLLLLFLAWSVYNLVRWLFRHLSPHTSRWVQWLLTWGRAHPVMGEIARALADPNHPETRGLSILATLLVMASVLFTLLLGLLPEDGLHVGLDNLVLQALQSLRTPWADHLMVYFSHFTDTLPVIILSLGLLLFLYLADHRRAASYWLAAVLFAVLGSFLLKLGLQVPRPEVVAHPPGSWSFPSGHTLKAVVLFGFLSVMIARPLSDRWRWFPYSLAAMLIFAVALSRLYLGVHWLSDVAGSLTLGLAWVSLLGLAYNRHERQPGQWRGLALAGLLLVGGGVALESILHHQQSLERYQPARSLQRLAADAWWRDQSPIPAFRADLRQRQDHPLNLQYDGDLAWLGQQLKAAGWQPAPRLNWRDWLRVLAPDQPLQALPVLPQVHDGRHEALLLIKPLPRDRRLVLRLWESNFRLGSGARPLWIGNVSEQQQVRLLQSITYARTAPGFQGPLRQLREDLAGLPAEWRMDGESSLRIRAPAQMR